MYLFNYNPDDLKYYHRKYQLLSDKKYYSDCERNILEDWTEGFVDRDNKIIIEFRDTFHSAFWEFYLHAVFKNNGFILDQSHNRPDFIITAPYLLNIEAVTSQIKQTGIPECQRNMNDILSMVTPPWAEPTFYSTLDESIVRLSNSINLKHNKLINEYSMCDWVQKSTPFALAVSSYDQVNYGCEYIYSMMALLYGLYFNIEDSSFSKKTFINKPGTESHIPLGLFLDNAYEDISGIIFSCTLTLGKLESLANSLAGIRNNLVYVIRHDPDDIGTPYKIQVVNQENPEYLEDGLFLFHNPKAKNKIPLEMFHSAGVYQLIYENDTIKNSPEIYPLIARISFDKNLERNFLPYIEQQLMLYNRRDLKDIMDHFRKNF